METEGRSEERNAKSFDAKEGQNVILNIREAHDQDKIYAKSIGFVINDNFKKNITNNLQNSYKDYLQVDCIGTETVSDKFSSIDDFILNRGFKNNDEPKNISTEPLLSIVRVNGKQKANERHPNRSQNIINDSIFTPSFFQQDNNRLKQQVIDNSFNDFGIVTKESKDNKKQFEGIFMSATESNQSSILNKSKFIMVSNSNLLENSTPKPKNKRKKSTVAKKVTKTV